jgi:acetyltransferase-like isoleucine patch superfamily enzyme
MIRTAVSAAANLLIWPVRAGNVVAAPFVRLWRLVRLRSYVTGDIPVTTQFDGPVHAAGRVRLSLGEHCRLGRDVFFETVESGSIKLGAHVRINAGCVFVSYSRIEIGSHCLIGEYVSIRDADHGTEVGEFMRLQSHCFAPITIGGDVWVGRGAVILKGVTIGDGAVVAANSVVAKDIPSWAIVAGAPARVLRYRQRDDRPTEKRERDLGAAGVML